MATSLRDFLPALKDIVLETNASQCLLRFVNNDTCETYTPQNAAILDLIAAAQAHYLPVRCDLLKQEDVCQTVLIIDFNSERQLQEFAATVCPLPIQFRYEGEWSGGFQFLEPDLAADLKEAGMMAIPDAKMLARFEVDTNYVCEAKQGKPRLQQVASTGFNPEAHSFAIFPDLMTLDIDTCNREAAIAQIEAHCKSHPSELWAIYQTQKGLHAHRIDAPVRPSSVSTKWLEGLGVDRRYVALCQRQNEWSARITQKSNRANDFIQFERCVGTGQANSELRTVLEAYQQALISNGLDQPEVVNRLHSSLGVSQADQSTRVDFSGSNAMENENQPQSRSVTIYTDGAAPGNNRGAGGWGAIVMSGDFYSEAGGRVEEATNNISELTAAISGLKAAESLGLLQPGSTITLKTDSKYVQEGATQWLDGWKAKNWRTSNREPVKNQALWQEVDRLKSQYSIQFEWVKGHAQDVHNNRADQIASSFARGVTVELKQDLKAPELANAIDLPETLNPPQICLPILPVVKNCWHGVWWRASGETTH